VQIYHGNRDIWASIDVVVDVVVNLGTGESMWNDLKLFTG
jgi:hypothetical protein